VLAIGSVKNVRRKYKIIIFLVSFIFLPSLFSSNFHDFFVWVEALSISGRLTVPPPFKVDLTIFIDDQLCPSTPEAYCLGETLNISNKLENVGSINLTGNLSTEILNPDNQLINQTDWFDINLSTGETKYLNTSYTVREEDDIGIYSIMSNYTYDGNYSFESCGFWVFKGIGTLWTSENELLFFIPPGKSVVSDPPLSFRLLYACDYTTAKMNKSSDVPGDWTSFSLEEMLLLPGEYNSTVVNVTVPMDTELGEYYGWIYANADGQQVPINLTVVVTIIDFYVKTRIPGDIKQNGVCQGKNVYAEVNITKLSPAGQVDINMTYQLLHEGNVITETEESLTLNDTFNSMIRVPILTVLRLQLQPKDYY